jgi:hypothetical protein
MLNYVVDSMVEGCNPGGGGIELLSRLTGRSRALEVVLGADRIDADTAARYGCTLFLLLLLGSYYFQWVNFDFERDQSRNSGCSVRKVRRQVCSSGCRLGPLRHSCG